MANIDFSKKVSAAQRAADAKAAADLEAKAQAQAYLTSTDWYAMRYAELGTAIPDDVKAGRAEARAALNEG
jgi:hypothetical protein